jgi:hypothetical protein
MAAEKVKARAKPTTPLADVNNIAGTALSAYASGADYAPSSYEIANVQILFNDDDNIGELHGTFVDGDNLYLVSRQRGLAFDSLRTDDGQLKRVGILDVKTGKVVLDAVVPAAPDEPRKPLYPYNPNSADHCETPSIAYEDISPVLFFLARAVGKTPSELRIYDPYFCAGSIKRHLVELGYSNVYNMCEDFYEKIATGTTPEYDVLITNPPYLPTDERDHVEEITKFITASDKPWLILQPNYVYTKDYWTTLTSGVQHGPRPFFLTPPQPRDYVYETPRGLRDATSSKRKTSPFVTFFYCWLGPAHQMSFYKWWVDSAAAKSRLSLACSEFYLPENFKDSADKTRKKRRSKKRPRTTINI